ncbi:MAG: acyl-CoA thioesterase, partial [Pseudomonadota bacterium]
MFSKTLSPRFYETDALGHINNVTIAAWFEVARMG